MKNVSAAHKFQLDASTLTLSIKISIIIFMTLALYHQDLAMVGNEAIRSELMSYILAVPFLLAYLLYRKRRMLKAVIPFEAPVRKTIFIQETVGAMLCLLAFLLYWHGYYTFYPLEYHIISLPIFVAGCILIMFNVETLTVLAFPIAFLLFLTPLPLETVYIAGKTLSIFSSEAAYNVLKAIGLPVSLATQYETPVIIVETPRALLTLAIDIACAGVYSLIGFTIFAVFTAYIVRGALWKKAIVFLTSIPLIYALNIARIVTIVLIGYHYGGELAMEVFHLFGGWVLIFLGTFLLLFYSEKVWKIQIFTKKSGVASCSSCDQSLEKKQTFCLSCGKLLKYMDIKVSKRDLSKIIILITSASLIIFLEVPTFALKQGPPEIILQSPSGEQATTQILPEIQGYNLRFIYRDEEFEEIARQDASLVYAYIPLQKPGTTIWVTMEIAKSRSSLHRWELCLITYPQSRGYQPQVTQLDLRDVQLLSNPPIIGRFFVFQQIKTNITQVVLYWYENALFKMGSSFEQEYLKIGVIAYANNPDFPKVEEQLLPIGKAIANHWQPIKTWSQVTVTIAQYGNTIILIITALLTTALTIETIKKQIEKKSNLKIYNKLALEEEKLIIQAVHKASQKNKSTLNAIASTYHKLAGKPIELNLLIEKLNEAEEAGLVKREIISRNDEPIFIWKSHVSF